MEAYSLYHNSQICNHKVDSVSCCLVLAQRQTNEILSLEKKHEIILKAGEAVLNTLTQWHWNLDDELNDESCVWYQK